MKNLLFLSILLLSLFSCQESLVDTQIQPEIEDAELPVELQHLLDGIQTRGDWPKDAWEMADFLNTLNFTHGRYKDCETPLAYASFSGANSTDENEQDGPLYKKPVDHEYTYSDLSKIITILWERVNKECDTEKVVIVDIYFSVGFFGNGNTNYYIDADVTLCCDPTFNPKETEGPKQAETPNHG